jgi:hypothetical protein
LHDPLPSLGFCTALIAAGASVNVVNLKGVTPYGQALLAARYYKDFSASFHLPGPPTDTRALEALLMPAAGPSLADKSCR